MQAIILFCFSAYFAFLSALWIKQWRRGEISRFPAFRTVYKAKEPTRFKVWSIIHGSIFLLGFGVLMLAWIAFANGGLK
jgi:hypothetical protein